MTFYGADVDALRRLADTFQARAEELEATGSALRVAVTTAPWRGPDADELRARWHGELEVVLRAAGQLLVEGAQTLRVQAQQQESASTDGGGAGAGGETGGTGGTGRPDAAPLAPPASPAPASPSPPAGDVPTVVATETYTFESSVGIGSLEGGSLIEYRVDELSDGTFRMTQIGGLSVGIGTGVPTPYIEGTAGGHDVNVGVAGGGSVGSVGNVGLEYSFASQDEVDDFVAYQQRQMRDGIGLNAFETYTPPEPTATIYEFGDYATGTAGAAVVPLVGGQAEVHAEALAGVRYDESAGTTTVYVRGEVDAEVSGQGVVPGEENVGGPGLVAVTYDSKGNVVPNPPSSLVAPPDGGTTETVMEIGGSAQTPLPVVGGAGGGVSVTHERTEYPQDG